MKHSWVLDVLADLQHFARANRLDGLARHLSETREIGAADLAALGERVRVKAHGGRNADRRNPDGDGGRFGP